MRTSGASQPAQLLLDVIDILHANAVPYAVIGALAVSYYGIPRSTTDADVVVWLNEAKTAQEVRSRFQDAGYLVELRRGDPDDPIMQVLTIHDAYDNRVDLVGGVRGMDARAQHRCVTTTLMDSAVRIIGAEDLVAMKIFAGNFQDLEDARGILQVSGKLLDIELLRTLAQSYGVEVQRKLEELISETTS